MTRSLAVFLCLSVALGCAADESVNDDASGNDDASVNDDAQSDGNPINDGTPAAPEVVSLTTTDDVALEGDFYPAGDAGPGVLLLHMIPPGNDRSNWPESFRTALQARGWGVLALDRRGAGASEGVAVEAYEGPNGTFDAQAGVAFLTDRGHSPIAILGASNGTTTTVDYTIWAPDNGQPVPVALGFLTGGGYTENQNAMTALPDIPALFTYSTAERDWSVAQQALGQSTWEFEEYANGDHGTRMFDAAPEVSERIQTFLDGAFE